VDKSSQLNSGGNIARADFIVQKTKKGHKNGACNLLLGNVFRLKLANKKMKVVTNLVSFTLHQKYLDKGSAAKRGSRQDGNRKNTLWLVVELRRILRELRRRIELVGLNRCLDV